MVLIITKHVGDRCDVILIPKRTLNNMLTRHVSRVALADRENTCIVTKHRNWTGHPTASMAISALIESVKNQRVDAGERYYPIPHHIFGDLKCRSFNQLDRPTSGTYDGDFKINFIYVQGRGSAAIAQMQSYEKLGPIERLKIKNTFKNIEGKCKREMVFLAHHIHPVRRR